MNRLNIIYIQALSAIFLAITKVDFTFKFNWKYEILCMYLELKEYLIFQTRSSNFGRVECCFFFY